MRPGEQGLEGSEEIVSRAPFVWSFRRPSLSFVWRFFAHLIIRLLVITPLPPHFQAAAVLFPVSMLWPFVRPAAPPHAEPEASPEGDSGSSGAGLLPLSGSARGICAGGTEDRLRPTNILAGRESVRGTTGGNVPVTVTDGDSRLVIPGSALPGDVPISLQQQPLSSFLPSATNLLALGEVLVDFSGRTLLIPAELSIRAVGGVVEGDTLVLAKVERIEGVPKLVVVSLAQLLGDRVVTRTGGGLPGVIQGGRYVFYRVSSPIGFIAGTTSTANGPVRAVVSTDTLPFIGLADGSGQYRVTALPGPVHVSALVPKTTLAGAGDTVVTVLETAPLDITLTGTATTATVTPEDGTLGIPTSVQIEIEATAPLKPQTVTFTNILLKKDSDGTPVPVLLSLSGSRKVIGIVPQTALEYSTTYRLEVSGLLDTYDGPVNVPVTRFTTKDNTPPVYDLEAIVFSMPDANGMVTVSAPAGTLPPTTQVLIINEGNGVVVSFMVGNDGGFAGELPASISDRLLVTVQDPAGNTVSFQRSQYVAPDGTTGIGPGGGKVQGTGGTELRIPDGAVTRGVTLQVTGLSADELNTLFPNQAPDLPGAHMGSGIKIESPDKPTFKKEIDLVFPVPQGLPATPTDAWFYVYRRVELPPAADGTPRSAFETLDQAFIEGTGADAKVVTASYPFSGYLTSFGGITMPAAGQIALQAYASNYAILMWSYDQLLPAKPLPGVVTGKVRRTKWNPGSSVPEYEAIKEAKVTGLDQPLGTSNGNFAVTNDDGVFTLWDPAYTGGPVTVKATVKTPTGSESLEAVAYQANAADWGTTGLQHYRNIATVNITFDAVEPPPAAPVLEVRVMKKNPDGTLTNTNGLAVVDDDLVIGFVSHLLNGNVLTVNSVTIQGQPYSTQGPLTDDPNDFDFVVNGDYTPTNPGTYRIEATALVPMGSPISISATFRVIAAGGQVETDLANPPSVIFRSPKADATGVPVTVFPEIRFNEPVKNLLGNVHLYELACGVAGTCTMVGEVGLTLSGVGPGGAFPNVGADTVITTLTLQPLVGLKYGTDPSPIAPSPRYRISLTDEIVDLDTPTAKHLTPFRSEFETFKPTGVGGTQEHFGSPGIVVLQDRAYLVQNNFVNGTLRAYDVSDPVEPTEILSAQATVTWRPVDLAGEENTSVTGGRLIAISTGSTTQSKPSNVYVFDTSSDAQSKWIGAVSLTSSAMDGFIFRTAVKGGWLYAATYRKGIQAVDLLQVKNAFPPCCTIDYWNMVQAFNADGQGFGQENVVSIPVMNASNQPVRLWDLEAADYTVDNTLQRYVVATGEEPLVVANPGAQQLPFRAPLLEAKDGATVLARLAVGKAIGLGRVNDQELAVVAGHGTIGTTATPLAMVVSMANPAAPQVLGFVGLTDAPQDVLVKDDMALIGHESSVSVVSLIEPAHPVVTGALNNVGGRLALAGNLLFSTAYSATGGTLALGGIRVATLQTIATIQRVSPFVFGVNNGQTVSARDVAVDFRVVPAMTMSFGQVQVFKNGVALETLPAIVNGADGTAVWPKDRTVDPKAQYSVEAVANPGNNELRSARRVLVPVVVDADVDSDNNDGLANPRRDEAEDLAEDVQGNVQRPGKVIFANDGDIDGDGAPGFADGLDRFEPASNGGSSGFVPMLLELPAVRNLDQAKVRFTYAASDPLALTRAGDPNSGFTYALPPGALRIWTKDGQMARKAASVENGGDFVPSGRDLSVSALGTPLQGRTWKLYVEAMGPSTAVGEQQVKVRLAVPEANEPDVEVSDAVRFTALSHRLVQADAGNHIRPAQEVSFSHPSPVVSVGSARLTNLRLSDDHTRILGDLEVTGQVSCAVCDYTPGEQGTLDGVRLFFKDRTSPMTTLAVTGSKANEAPSLLRPFAYAASFSGVVPGVEVDEGNNLVRVEAADKVYGITGYSELSLGVTGTEPAPIVTDYRVRLDFGGAHSLGEVTPDRAVHLRVVDKARVPEGVFEGDVFRTAEDPLTFSSAEATVTVSQAADLDAALSTTVTGQFDVTVSVPSLAAWGFFHRLKETGSSTSVFVRDLLHSELTLHGPLNASAPDTVDVVVEDGFQPALSRTLTETGADTRVFAAGDGSVSITIPVAQPFAPGVLQFDVTASGLGIATRQAIGIETGTGTGVFATIEATQVDSIDRTDYSGWTFAAEEARPGKASNGGEFNPYLLQVLGPDDFLAQMDTVETQDGPRRVRKAFDGNYYVFMKNSPPAVVIFVPTPNPGVVVVDPDLVGAQARFVAGYVKGFVMGGFGMVEGTLRLAVAASVEGARLSPLGLYWVMTFGDRYGSEIEFARKTKDLALKLASLSWAMQGDEAELMVALLSGNSDEAALISEPYRMAFEYGGELIEAAWLEALNSPPEKQGEFLGRVVFELATLAVIYAKAGQAGKLGFLNRVRELPFFRQNAQAMRALERLTGLMEGLATTKMCFVAGTRVHTAKGVKNIEDIVAGDRVLSRDPKTGAQGFRAVRETVVTHPTRLYHVRYRGREARSHGDRASSSSGDGDSEGDGEPSELVSTGEHPYFVLGHETFTPASDLVAGDRIALAGGGAAVVTDIRVEDAPGDQSFTTYNFEVEDFHTYFVGHEGVWVHNAGPAFCQRLKSLFERALKQKGNDVWAAHARLGQRLDALVGVDTSLGRNGAARAEMYAEALRRHFGDIPHSATSPPWLSTAQSLTRTNPPFRTGAMAEELASNMDAVLGVGKPPGFAAHHIVPPGFKDAAGNAEKLRQLLAANGIHLNEAGNGVYLPQFITTAQQYPGLGPLHSTLHTNRMMERLWARLSAVGNPNRDRLLTELQRAANDIVQRTLIP